MSSALLASAAVPAAAISLTAEIQTLAGRLRRITVRVATTRGRFDSVGAGIVWPSSTRSIVMTNAHVVPRRRGDQLLVVDDAGHRADADRFALEVLAR